MRLYLVKLPRFSRIVGNIKLEPEPEKDVSSATLMYVDRHTSSILFVVEALVCS